MDVQPSRRGGQPPVVIIQKLRRRKRPRMWPILVLAGAVTFWLYGLSEVRQQWDAILHTLGIRDRDGSFTRLFVAGCVVCCVVALAKAARGPRSDDEQ